MTMVQQVDVFCSRVQLVRREVHQNSEEVHGQEAGKVRKEKKRKKQQKEDSMRIAINALMKADIEKGRNQVQKEVKQVLEG